MRERFENFKNDFLLVGLTCCNLLLLVSMFFSPEPRDVFFWGAFAFRLMFPFVALLLGERGAWFFYFVYTNFKALDMTYDNFTTVAVICVLFSLLPSITKRKAIAITAIYICDVFVVATFHNKAPYHIFVHLVGCVCFCLAMWKLKVDKPIGYGRPPLSLLPDEESILQQMASGVQIKNIEGYSENTVFSHLKKARVRNKFQTNEALLLAFINERA